MLGQSQGFFTFFLAVPQAGGQYCSNSAARQEINFKRNSWKKNEQTLSDRPKAGRCTIIPYFPTLFRTLFETKLSFMFHTQMLLTEITILVVCQTQRPLQTTYYLIWPSRSLGWLSQYLLHEWCSLIATISLFNAMQADYRVIGINSVVDQRKRRERVSRAWPSPRRQSASPLLSILASSCQMRGTEDAVEMIEGDIS